MLSELSANSFVYCVSSRITTEIFQVASQLVFNSMFRILWVTLNFYRVASQLDSFLCFGFCGLHWTCFELPANSFLCFGFSVFWIFLTHSCVLDFVDYIGRVSSCQPIRSCVLDFVNYIGRVSSCQPIHSSVF